MIRMFLSVVSHGHGEIIQSSFGSGMATPPQLAIVIKDNLGESDLKYFCKINNIHYLDFSKGKGFGENNNLVFDYCVTELGMSVNDYFVCVNPDVKISASTIEELFVRLHRDRPSLFTVRLYKDSNFRTVDPAIRRFPRLSDFVKSFFFKVNPTILDEDSFARCSGVAWAAGSFLGFGVNLYKKLNGFDRRYFMYCEDIDICLRALSMGENLKVYWEIKAVHFAAHRNVNVFSKHFIWHLTSIFIYLKKYGELKGVVNKAIVSMDS